MKTVKSGSRMELYELAHGVRGYAIKHKGSVYIPLIEAITPGSGDVGRFLDSLPGDFKQVKIPNVMSPQLRGMLERRGFRLSWEYPQGEKVDVWLKP